MGHKKHLLDKVPDLVGRNSRKSTVAVRKEFGMVKCDFVTKNARFGVKEFATEI